MPKRKRSTESDLRAALENHQVELSRALKAAKGFERQRLSKRLREDGVPADKQRRLEREIAVLKSLDLHQTARAHLMSSLLKVKPIAASPDFPDALRAGVPKPDVPEEERAALHNVTSGLYNREPVKQATDRAIAAVCRLLDVSTDARAKRPRKGESMQTEGPLPYNDPAQDFLDKSSSSDEEALGEESEFDGFESDVDEPGPAIGKLDSGAESAEESEIVKLDRCLGSSSDEDDDEMDEAKTQRFKGTEKVNLDDISLSEHSSDAEDEQVAGSTSSHSPSPPPAKRKTNKEKLSTGTKLRPTGNSTFLPSLMGGYISGSESASEIEEAKPKARRGQRARQAIWEKKYGSNARHLQNPKQKGGRDAGWDVRRGAVAENDRDRKSPWKRGIRDPLAKGSNDSAAAHTEARERGHKPARTDNDDGRPLHPSWTAKKKAQDAQRSVAFSGQKVVFD